MKYYLLILLIVFVGCNNENAVEKHIDKTSEKMLNAMKAVDSVKPDYADTFQNDVDSTVKVLLLEYYKKGWMDGSNGVIDLHNQNNLSDETLKSIQKKDWRNMEAFVNAKK